MKPLFVSCHTPDELYTAAAERLRVSLEKFGLDYEIVPYDARGTWSDNTCYKATFLKEIQEKHQRRPIVWLDADAEVVAHPSLFFGPLKPSDLAVRFRKNQLLSGTVYLANNERTTHLIEHWLAELMLKDSYFFDREQRALQQAATFLADKGYLNIVQLPMSYVAIFDQPHTEPPVILHHQCSRQGRGMYG